MQGNKKVFFEKHLHLHVTIFLSFLKANKIVIQKEQLFVIALYHLRPLKNYNT